MSDGFSFRIHDLFKGSEGAWWCRRIHPDLLDQCSECSPGSVRDIMRVEGLVACQPSSSAVITEEDTEAAAGIPDILGRGFTGDITY